MKNKLIVLAGIFLCFIFASCATTNETLRSDAYRNMYAEDPVSVLIMPPINLSTNADAKDFFYSTLNVPLADVGYYVLPPFISMYTLQRESAYDSERFIDGDVTAFGYLFGVDMLLFTVIESWNKALISHEVEVDVKYIFKSTKTNKVLFSKRGIITVDTSSDVGLEYGSCSGILMNMIVSTINTVMVDYVDIARECNDLIVKNQVPYGYYHPLHGLDGDFEASQNVIHAKKNID